MARELLERLVNVGRLAPSAANLQPLEFIVVDEPGPKAEIFPCLKWAAYVVTLVNTKVREMMFEYAVGAAMENMILAALTEGVGSCWFLSIDRDGLRAALGVPEHYRVGSVLALGYPDEEPAAEVMGESCRYWKDTEGRLHVPKRAFETVVHFSRF